MLNSVSQLHRARIGATDGPIGHIEQVYFDDQAWVIRYFVVDTGSWLLGREVLISPYSVEQPVGSGDSIDVTLTRAQVEHSPPVDTHRPVSRQHERDFLSYYAYPEYWGGSGLWPLGEVPILPTATPREVTSEGTHSRRDERYNGPPVAPEDVHLRSSAAVSGYDIQASDGSIGHVKDFIFDDESWAIRYLVVDTRNWWPGGRKVLVATRWIDRIEWADNKVFTSLTREQVKASPEYHEADRLERADEKRLHDAYGREGYWD
jgi:uncharacterized protein YrrD